MDYTFEQKMKVRDYECDLQGIVNNANYQHYIEHTRHEYLTSRGISFAKMHAEGIDAVVARITISYKTPLTSGDEFVSKLYLKREGIKYVFYQKKREYLLFFSLKVILVHQDRNREVKRR